MEFRQLGRSGLTVSAVGLGCNALGRGCDFATSKAIVHAALDSGVTFFDTADVYGTPRGTSEEYLGRALGSHRDEIVLASKFGNPAVEENAGSSRRYIRRAVEGSLRRLGTDRIDLFQLHASDARTPVEETLSTLESLINEGKINYAGSSMFAEWETVEAEWIARHSWSAARFVSTQTHFNLLYREAEREMLRACARYGIGVIPFFPLARGLLTGKYQSGVSLTEEEARKVGRPEVIDEQLWIVDRLIEFARARGVTLATVAIRWLLTRPAVSTVIAGATKPEQVRSNALAIEWVPSADDLSVLDELIPPPQPALHRVRPLYTR